MDDYWYYSLFTLFMLLIFEGTVVKFRMKNLQQLREMLRPPTVIAVSFLFHFFIFIYFIYKSYQSLIIIIIIIILISPFSQVQREGKWNMISSEDLLPGDICLLSSRTSPLCPADMLLLSGQVVVNESLLTGSLFLHLALSTFMLTISFFSFSYFFYLQKRGEHTSSERSNQGGGHRRNIEYESSSIPYSLWWNYYYAALCSTKYPS